MSSWLLFFLTLPFIASTAFARPGRIINGAIVEPKLEWHKKLLQGAVRIGSVHLDAQGQPIPESFRGYCSGTLIEGRRIASANHCFAHPFIKPNLYAEIRVSIQPDVRKLVRLNRVSTAADPNELLNIMNTSGGDQRELDLALAEFEDVEPKIDSSQEVKVCKGGLSVNSHFVAAGFGLTEDPAADLSKLRMTALSIEEIKPGTIWSHPIKDESDRTTCFGDSGGGLFAVHENGQDLCLSGVVSGNDSGNGGAKPPNTISNAPRPPDQRPGVTLGPIVAQPISPPNLAKRCLKAGQRQIFARIKSNSGGDLNHHQDLVSQPQTPRPHRIKRTQR